MKWIPALFLTLFALPALGADAIKPPYTIIDGRKFYSLQNARHFLGGTTPAGMMVLHHARPAPPGHRAPPLAMTPASGQTQATAASPASTMPDAKRNDILSVFTPDEANPPPVQGLPKGVIK